MILKLLSPTKKISACILLILIQLSCSLKSENTDLGLEGLKNIEAIENIFTQNQLVDLAPKQKEGDKDSYIVAATNTVNQIAKLWDTEAHKLSITSYFKEKDLTARITAYNYSNSEIVKTDIIPEKILNSFNKDFKCPKPDKNSPIKRSSTFPFETEEFTLIISIEEFK